jgi:hypothetical protein
MHKKSSVHKAKNWRPITPQATLGKIYDKILDNGLRDTVLKPGEEQIDQEQGGFRSKRNAIGQVYTITATAQLQARLLFIALLDIRSAFDRMWRSGAFWLIHKAGYRGTAWDNLVASYDNNQTRIYLDHCFSDWITHKEGVIQGRISSPIIFLIFIDPLIKALRKAGIGVRIGGKRVPGALFADDIAIIARSEKEMRLALKITTEWADKWRITFADDKCVIIAVNGKSDAQFTLQGKRVGNKQFEKYLGIIINNEGLVHMEHIKARIANTLKAVRAMVRTGVRAWGMRTEVTKTLNTTLFETIMGYGLGLVPASTDALATLRKAQGKMAKLILGVCKYTSTTAALAILGWLPAKYNMAIARIRTYLTIKYGRGGPSAQALLEEEEKKTKWGSTGTHAMTDQLQKECNYLGAGDHVLLPDMNSSTTTTIWTAMCNHDNRREWAQWNGNRAPLVKLAAPEDITRAKSLLDPNDPPATAAVRTRLLLSWPLGKETKCNTCGEMINKGELEAIHVLTQCNKIAEHTRQAQLTITTAMQVTKDLTPMQWTAIITIPHNPKLLKTITRTGKVISKTTHNLIKETARKLLATVAIEQYDTTIQEDGSADWFTGTLCSV